MKHAELDRKIHDARQSGVDGLDLSGLTSKSYETIELPKSLGELVHLKTLDLSSNRLAKLPAWIGGLEQL